MRLAVITDIHGNAAALKAVLKDINQNDIDCILCRTNAPYAIIKINEDSTFHVSIKEVEYDKSAFLESYKNYRYLKENLF